MTNEITKTIDMTNIEQVLLNGDLSKLDATQRVTYYQRVCQSIGLNPLTRPFDYITLNGKLTLYAKKDAADQLRKLHNVSIDDVDIQDIGDNFVVKVKGHDDTGRSDVEIGVVGKKDMQGNSGNAQMKAVTKAKRRLTLSLCGLGWLDEIEIETFRDARPVVVKETGEIVEGNSAMATMAIPNSSDVWDSEQGDGEPLTPLQEAMNLVTSKGQKYGDLTDHVLHMIIDSDKSPQTRKNAAELILAARAKSSPAE
jgi:hypothetical protein